jgi:LemA protein
MSIFEWVILAVVVAGALFGLMRYNRLVAMRQQCSQSFADIDVLLRQRRDLVPNLVETVKGYAAHERGTLDSVVQARNAAAAAQGPAEKAKAENALSAGLRQIFALAEAYPDLKANSNFLQLQSELTGIEDRLATARRAYNAMVQGYNSMVQRFPAVLFARTAGFTPHEFFDLGDARQATQAPPQVKF